MTYHISISTWRAWYAKADLGHTISAYAELIVAACHHFVICCHCCVVYEDPFTICMLFGIITFVGILRIFSPLHYYIKQWRMQAIATHVLTYCGLCVCVLVMWVNPAVIAEHTKMMFGGTVVMWAQGIMYQIGCSWMPPGKYSRTVCAQWLCRLLKQCHYCSKLFVLVNHFYFHVAHIA